MKAPSLSKDRLMILTNIPTPYRTAFFNVLNEEARADGVELKVLYCASSEPNRNWSFDPAHQRYTYRILPGRMIRTRRLFAHVNPSAMHAVWSFRPNWLIVAGAWNTPTMLLALLVSRGAGMQRLFWSEGHEAAESIRTGWVPLLRGAVYRAFDGYVVPNDRSAEYARRLGGTRQPILRLPNTVDEAFFRSPVAAQRQRLRTSLQLADDEIVVVTVAQLEDRKGVRELVKGFHLFAARGPFKLQVRLVGDGPLRAELQELIQQAGLSDKVRLTGALDQSGVRELLHAADVFLLPTKLDPNPLSPIEAAFAGLALVLSRAAGNAADLVQEGVNGFTLERVTVDVLREVFVSLEHTGRAELNRMGLASQRIAEASFGRRTAARSLLSGLRDGDHRWKGDLH